ncbi:branched-chain amino acid ABC transporter permease [Nocardioides sp. LHG3406-4]|uniref:branched-chain amino acid ABC transporter permease n=1 Tax=Nocardioides sp. LHG3406-4 TaxID=2804575 RepID=UPI003CE6C3F9
MQEIVGAVSLGSIYLMFALGMSAAWGTIGILNFAHGSIFMFSVFVSHQALAQTDIPIVGLALIAIVVGAALSFLTQVLAFDQIIKRSTSERAAETRILIGGIGVAMIPLAIAAHVTKNSPFGLQSAATHVKVWQLGGVRISSVQIVTIVCALTIAAALGLWLRRSRQGLALRSLGVDAQVASLMGIDGRRLAWGTMAFAGGLAGLAGILLTLNLGAITAHSGDSLLIKAFACVVLGGVGSTLGVVTGCFMLAFAETLVLTQTSGLWVEAVSFGLIFAVLLLRPQGIFGHKEVQRV